VSSAARRLWTARGAWDGVMAAGRHGCDIGEPGIRAAPREGLALASVVGRGGRAAELGIALSELAGVSPPAEPKIARGRDGDLVWAGSDQWLLVSERLDMVGRASATLAGLAAVSDQSDARALIRVRGPMIRDVLAKGCLVDLHPRAFRPGDAALTSIAHIGVHLWQLDNEPTYELAVFRSMAVSFWSWLAAASAEYGCEIAPADARG
jgi:methylglutamate dehydrogenase subunit D